MSIRRRYSNDTLDEVFCCFMRTILHLQETGIEKLPVENDLPEPVRSYMDLAIELLIDGQPPEPSRIILESEYDVLLHCGKADIETVTFYPNLPAEIRKKYRIDDLIKYMPHEMFRLDDY